MDQTFNSLTTKTLPKIKKADPWDAVPVKNSKYARDTTEVHLGKRDAEVLLHFAEFENLQTVWVNDNRLKNLEGLEKNFRVKHLYAQKNRISCIRGVIEKLKHLETLSLYDNELRDLEDVLGTLKILSSLKCLELFDNPIAQEPNYKARVLAAIPTLELFDRHIVTPEEKDAARKFIRSSKSK